MSNAKKRILVADDDARLLQAVSTRLEAAGFVVIPVQDAYRALDRCRHEKPDVLLLDINMPAGSGFSVQERMTRNVDFPTLPVIYMTGDTRMEVELQAHDMGAVAVIHKPIDMKELLHVIWSVLDTPTKSKAS